MPALKTRLTDHGKVLYHIHRNATREELTINEFLDHCICNAPAFKGHCQHCGSWAKLCGGFYCVPCTAGVIETK